MSDDLKISMTLNVLPEIAFKAIANVKGWWATNVSGEANEKHKHFSVRFGKTFADIEVMECVPGKTIIWQIKNSLVPLFRDPTEWNNTSLKWELYPEIGRTTIVMTHQGLTPEKECFLDCQKGWTFYVTESLKKLILEGHGMPGTGIFSYIIADKKRYNGLLFFKNDPLPDYPNGHIYIDVKNNKGEQVTSAYTLSKYNKQEFNSLELKGDYFMILDETFAADDFSSIEHIKQALF